MDPSATASGEDYNERSSERKESLQSLDRVLRDVPKYFWALCLVLDLGELQDLVEMAERKPAAVRILARETRSMLAKCGLFT